jgi:hypothetical protein
LCPGRTKARQKLQRPAFRGGRSDPPLIEGEDAAAYDQLLVRICAAVKPVDIIDEIFIADVSALGVGGVAVTPLEMELDPSART